MFKAWRDYWIIKSSGLFDPFYYLFTYPDIRWSDVDPLRHFVNHGWKEGRNPSASFNTSFYLKTYPDVVQSGINPLLHYIQFGRQEGRAVSQERSATGMSVQRKPVIFPELRRRLTPVLKFFYKLIPLKYRQTILIWSFKHAGFLFAGLMQYQLWRSGGQNRLHAGVSGAQNLVNISQVPPAQSVRGKIAIHIHLFYSDLADEFAGYLQNMPFRYDLYLSIPDNENPDKFKRLFGKLKLCDTLVVRPVPNRGRDSAPLICAFRQEMAGHDFIAHLHSKKSIYNKGSTEGWREYLCKNLMGSEERIRKIFTLLQDEHPSGIVYPQNYPFLPYWANTWLANRGLAQAWCPRLGISDIPRGYFDYPASSMFWARGDALAPLFNAGITLDDFPPENGQTDGTLAHFIERSFGLCTLSQGLPVAILRERNHADWSPWRLDQYINRPFQHMLEQVMSPDIKLIGFDIFDTLFCRPLVDPESVKTIVSKRISERDGLLYLQYRALAEQQDRECKGADVGMEDIYTSLQELTGLPEERLKEIRQIEETTEITSLEPRREAIALYREALATGRPVVLISDMFLPQSLLEDYLCKNGLDGWDGLFLSNEVGLRKDTGQLYQQVLKQYGLSPSEFLMIGDSERSDVQIPCDMGAKFLHVFRPVELARGLTRFSNLIHANETHPDLDDELTLGLVVRQNFSPITYTDFDPSSLVQVEPYTLGFSLVGPLLTGLSQWLLEQSRQDGIDRLYFLAREGKLIKDIFDCWCQDKPDVPTSAYLVVSRRAVGAAAMTSLDDILDIARTVYYPNHLENFLHTRYGLTLSDDRWKEVSAATGLNGLSIIKVENREVKPLQPLLQMLEKEILAQAQKEKEPLLAWFKELGLNLDDRQAVVDIGYGGSVQGYMNKLLPRKVHGYYLMTDERAEKVAELYQILIRGCFYEKVDRSSLTPILYRYSFEMEKLLSSDEPQIEYYETSKQGNPEGHFRPLLPEELACNDIRAELQRGAMDFVKQARLVQAELYPQFRPSCETARHLMEAFLLPRSEAEESFLSKIVLDDYYCGRGLVS